jgi:hypothetical protein
MSNEIRQYRRKGSDAHWVEHTRETADHWGYFVGSPEYETRILYTAPQEPAAPVGVEGLVAKWRGLANDALRRSGTWNGDELADWIEFMADELEALSQQPAAVEDARVERAAKAAWPAFKSGLEGANWAQAPQLRKDRLRIIVRTALTAALYRKEDRDNE